MKDEPLKALFLPSGCLSIHALEALLQKNLEGDALHQVQNHLDECELCSDALEGYRRSRSASYSLEEAQKMSRDIFNAWTENPIAEKEKSMLPVFLRVAASIVLLLGIWGVFRWIHSSRNNSPPIASSITSEGSISSSGYYTAITESGKKLTPPAITEETEGPGRSSQDKGDGHSKENAGLQEEKTFVPVSPAPEKLVNATEDPRLPETDEPTLFESGNEPLRPYPAGNGHVKGGPSGKGMSFYYNVEDMPRFRSGDLELFRHFVQEQIRYPHAALREGLEGTVYVRFIVEPSGQVSHVVVVQGVSEILDREAIRVVSASPAWRPGRHHGEKVNVGFIIPVKFQIQ